MMLKVGHFKDEDSIASASISHGDTGTASGEEKRASEKDVTLDKTLARKETKAVHCLRFVVLLVLMAAATAASATVYLYLKRDEEAKFEEQFYDLAYRLGKCYI